MLFGLQMTSYEMFDDVVKMIDDFVLTKLKIKVSINNLKIQFKKILL